MNWLRAFLPARVAVDARERARAVVGVLIGLLVTAGASAAACAMLGVTPWFAAPLGASALLVFVAPASPLAQPWAVVGGNTVAALVGMACLMLPAGPAIAGPVAVALATLAMFLLRCLHPPGGAVALLVVLAHAAGADLGAGVVLLNSALLVATGLIYNPLTGRRYPHRQVDAPAQPAPPRVARFAPADLDAVLARYNQVLDVSRDDLEEILLAAEIEAYRRHTGQMNCSDVMSRDPVMVRETTAAQEAWTLMQHRGIKALPVVDAAGCIAGIVTITDFLRRAGQGDGAPAGMRGLPGQRTGGFEAGGTVGQLMTRNATVAVAGQHATDLLPLFAQAGHHHIPVIDEQRRVVGIITESDFVRALYRMAPAPAAT